VFSFEQVSTETRTEDGRKKGCTLPSMFGLKKRHDWHKNRQEPQMTAHQKTSLYVLPCHCIKVKKRW
jgi:hypothetical protein